MCRNVIETSLFATIYIASIIVHRFNKTNPRYNSYLVFLSFFFIMETFQLYQWLFASVIHTSRQNLSCSLENKLSTYFGFTLIWLQPLLFAIIGLLSAQNNNNKKSIFTRLSVIYTGVFVLAIIGIVISTEFIKTTFPASTSSNYNNITCTFIGDNHHLVWNFTGFHVDYQANHLLYFILCIIAFVFYPYELLAIPISWIFTLFVTVFIFQVSFNELPAYWCVLSVFSNIIILGYEVFLTYYENRNISNTNN